MVDFHLEALMAIMLPSMQFDIFGLFLYPWTGTKHWIASINPLLFLPLSAISVPFSIREGLRNVIRYHCSFLALLAFISIVKVT